MKLKLHQQEVGSNTPTINSTVDGVKDYYNLLNLHSHNIELCLSFIANERLWKFKTMLPGVCIPSEIYNFMYQPVWVGMKNRKKN